MKNLKLKSITPFENQNIIIRLANSNDIKEIKRIADQERSTIGFVNTAVLQEAQKRGWLIVAVYQENNSINHIIGFCNFRIKQDKTCTLYEIAVSKNYRRQGVGKKIFQSLVYLANKKQCTKIQLKCPSELQSNNFYQILGCKKINTEEGKNKPLNLWNYFLTQNNNDQQKIKQAKFFASLTVNPLELNNLHKIWHKHAHDFYWRHGTPNPFANVLISPIFSKPRTFDFVKMLKESGETQQVMFDSGGYFLQKGDISFYDLTEKLKTVYFNETWADIYVLPDNPPLTKDNIEIIDYKVKQTVNESLKFLEDLPDNIKEKTMPVVHGANIKQIEYCQTNYLKSNTKFNSFGFGSFPTGGGNNTINRLNYETIILLKDLIKEFKKYGVGLHAFGISTPPAIYLLSLVGVTSFDSNGWMRSGGFGLAFLPFMRGYLVTSNSKRHKTLTSNEFQYWKELNNHDCPFCSSFLELSKSRWHRVLHNFVVMSELETRQQAINIETMKTLSFNYYQIFSKLNQANNDNNNASRWVL